MAKQSDCQANCQANHPCRYKKIAERKQEKWLPQHAVLIHCGTNEVEKQETDRTCKHQRDKEPGQFREPSAVLIMLVNGLGLIPRLDWGDQDALDWRLFRRSL